jgi:hypothetical protein
MRKILKITLGAFAIIILVGVFLFGVIISDVAGNTATGTHHYLTAQQKILQPK